MTTHSHRRTLWAACATFVPVAALAVLAVELVPRARGIGFFPSLRYAVMTPICALAALAAAFAYRRLGRARLRVVLAALAAVTLPLLALAGSPGLAVAAAPAVLVIAAALALLAPRFSDRPPGRVGAAATVLVGALELAGVVAALGSERVTKPGPGGMAFDVPRALFDVEHRFADLSNGARVHYVDTGSGETLLFLHGNPAWSFQWRDLIAGLRGRFRCVALDYPGFGLSSAPAGYGFTPREQSQVVEEFALRLGLRDVTLVMQDWGGPIGLGLAGRRPELVRRVILGNTWAWPTSAREPRGMFSKIVGGPLGEFLQLNFNAFSRAGLAQGVVGELPAEVTELYLRPAAGSFQRRGVAAFYPGQITAASGSIYMAEVEAGLRRIGDRPALIFWGMRDPGFPRPDLQRFERAFPDHRTIELPDASHFFFEDAAPRMVEEIGAFVRSPRATDRAATAERRSL